MVEHSRSGEHYARVERERRTKEPFLVAIVRLAIEDAIACAGTQTAAAKLLGENQQTLSRYLERAREREVNMKLGRADLNPQFSRHPYQNRTHKKMSVDEVEKRRNERFVSNHPMMQVSNE